MIKTPASRHIYAPIAAGLLLLTAACGGGGSDAGPASTPPPSTGGNGGGGTPSDPTWTQGVFQPRSQYENRCETVRTGVDIEGNPYPDMAGSTVYENFFLRSWTHETYLWNDEVADRDPANYSDPIAYFDLLQTTETTASGKPKDEFHFSQPTEEYLEQRNSVPTASYGANYLAYSTTPPRDFRIAYTDPNTPASEEIAGQPNLVRGSRILEIDGVDLVNANGQAALNTLNAGLFPENAGEMHTFVVEDPGIPGTRTVVLTAEDLSPSAVQKTTVIDTGTGKVGYAHITTFSPFASEEQIADAIAALDAQGITDLVLDLRYNGGGLLAVASQLGYMVAGDARTSGRTFEGLRFNDDAGGVNPVTGETDNDSPFYKTGLGFSLAEGAPLTNLNLSRVYILSTDNTCSASESIINGLRGVDVEVVLIGGTTCGKPYGFYPESNCGETYYSIQFQGVNDKGFGDYADGFIPANSSASFGVRIPGCSVEDDLSSDLGDETEAMLAAALQHRTNGACPTPSATASTARSSITASAAPIKPVEVTRGLNVMRYNRDMSMPD